MSHKNTFYNRALPSQDKPVDQVNCLECEEELVFHMRDNYHKFSIGLRTILECLNLAEAQGCVPPLPDNWWIGIATRHGLQFPQRE